MSKVDKIEDTNLEILYETEIDDKELRRDIVEIVTFLDLVPISRILKTPSEGKATKPKSSTHVINSNSNTIRRSNYSTTRDFHFKELSQRAKVVTAPSHTKNTTKDKKTK